MKKKDVKLLQYVCICVSLLFAFSNIQAQEENLVDEDSAGVCFNVDPEDDRADLNDGTDDAFDGYGELYIDDDRFEVDAGTADYNPPDATFGPETYSDLVVTRKVYAYVGPNCSSVARYLECLNNPTAAPITVEVKIEGDLGSDSDTWISLTSSCDNLATSEDFWFASNEEGEDWEGFDPDDGGDPPLAFNMYGPQSMIGLDSVFFEFEDDDLEFFYDSVTVNPGATVYIMHFITQNQTIAYADSSAAALLYPDAAALAGLSPAELAGILNFNLNCSFLDAALTGGGASCSTDPLNDLTVSITSPINPSEFPIQVVVSDGTNQTNVTLSGPSTSVSFPAPGTGTYFIESVINALGCEAFSCNGFPGSVTVSVTDVSMPPVYDPSNP